MSARVTYATLSAVRVAHIFVLYHLLHPGIPSMSKFTPSPQEVALVNQIFTLADAQKIGVVNGEAAVLSLLTD